MESLWDEKEASLYHDDLGMRVYTSRLLGRDPSLVLHGGGNTSVKITEKNIFGEEQKLLYVKGSGWDLETIDRPGFSPVKLDYLIQLASLPKLTDPEMVNELRTNLTIASAPTPSVEAILHATLPYKFVDHTHADAIVTITNTSNGRQRIEEIYGRRLIIVEYIMPGFDLARLCEQQYIKQVHDGTEGMLLLNHGLFTFADTAREAYENMIHLVDEAETYLKTQKAWNYELPEPPNTALNEKADIVKLAKLRRTISLVAGQPMILSVSQNEKMKKFSCVPNLEKLAKQGPATPDHVIRTKRFPMIGTDVSAYVSEYQKYFNTCSVASPQAKQKEKIMLDPAPRVILDENLGLVSVGKTIKDADIVADIYQHTVDVICRADALGGYRALSEQNIFDMEYWDLEQAKLKNSKGSPLFAGEVALVTGAFSGIGKACAEAFMAEGAAVVALDINPEIESLFSQRNFLGLICDVSDENQLKESLAKAALRFGGLDMLVLNAGLFPGGSPISELAMDTWRRVMAVNVDANLTLLRESYPLLCEAPRYGRVVVVGSRNVSAPGPGAAAYSASKAALTQLARVTALEWAANNIRINIVHPDAVFDTGIWSDEVLAARAKHYAMDVNTYKTKNLLKTEIRSADVAQLVVSMCGPSFSKTTAAQIPIDGGNDRVV